MAILVGSGVTAFSASVGEETKLEAENGVVVTADGEPYQGGEIVIQSDDTASNGKVVGRIGESWDNRSLVFDHATDVERSSLKIRYTASDGNYGFFDIYINDETEPYSLPFHTCGGWSMSVGTEVSGSIDIPAGARIRIAASGYGANIDYIILGDEKELPTIPTKKSIVRIEAESGYIVSPYTGLRIEDHQPAGNGDASGGKYYGNLDNMERGVVLENMTDQPKTGILIRYTTNNPDDVFHLILNDAKNTAYNLPYKSTGGWSIKDNTRYATGCMDIPAHAKLMIVPGFGCDIDYIELNDSTCAVKIPEGEWGDTTTALARELETEGIVLAQNNNRILPLDKEEKVAVFGRGQLVPATGGKGSGAINGAYTSSFIDGLTALGIQPYQELLDYYKERVSWSKIDHGWNKQTEYPGQWGQETWSGTTWSQSAGLNTPEVKLDGGEVTEDGLVARAAQNAKKAVVFITQTTGAEEMDRIKQNGDWYLDPSQRVLLDQVTDKFDDVVVILSVNGSIDMSWVKEYDVDAVMISYGAGSQNGFALADLVYGVENPSGKLADTITETYEEHPTADTFGYVTYQDMGLSGALNRTKFGDNDPISTYLEGVYIGYRYFDTFGKEVLYPFGSGLSYSDFDFQNMSVSLDQENRVVRVEATIVNVSEDDALPPGKEVMEVYISAPQGELEQPYQKLLDFEKTEKLAKGESQTLALSIPLKDCASYSEEKAAYILEPGVYYLRVGSSSRQTKIAGAFYVPEEILVEQLENRLTMSDNAKALFDQKALSNQGATPISYPSEEDEKKAARETAVTVRAENVETRTELPLERTVSFPERGKDEPVYTWSDVQSGAVSVEKFVSQMTEDEMIMMLSGNTWFGMEHIYYTDDREIPLNFASKNGGISGAGLTRSMERLGIPSLVFADGSAGIGFSGNIGWSRAAAVGCVWNKELIREYAIKMGKDMVDINCDVWLAPSINLHRNPLNGRNNEYYSEDPILSGLLAGVVAGGVSESGVTVCLKHYAGNDQEYYRRGHYNKSTEASGTSKDALNVIATERALRELILKPFEIAVKTGDVKNVMSSFNQLNGEYAASNHDLLTKILRDEWGFDGFVVTDWGETDAIAHGGEMMAAGVNVIMRGDHQMWAFPDQMRESLRSGKLTMQQLRTNAYGFVKSLLASSLSSMDGKHRFREKLTILSTSLPNAKSNDEYGKIKTNPLVAAGGNGSEYAFSVAQNSPDALPEGLTLRKDGTLSGKVKPGQEGEYQITFQVQDNRGNTDRKTLALTVVGELSFAPEQLPAIVKDRPYRQQLTVKDSSGQNVEAVFTVEGALPKGITLSESGLLSGTCTEIGNGSFAFSVSAKSIDGEKTGARDYVVQVIEQEVQIDTSDVAAAEVGANYVQLLEASHGMGTYRWSAKYLPEGFVLDGNRIVYGQYRDGMLYKQLVPDSLTGIYQFTVAVEDEMGLTDEKVFTLQVGDPERDQFMMTLGSLEDGKAGIQYENVALSSQNGVAPVSYFVDASGDSLPAGMQLSEDGVLSGTPAYTSAGEYRLVIKAVDSGNHTCTKSYSLYIAGGLTIDPAPHSIFAAQEGRSFKKQFKAAGGIMLEKKYELHETSDALPDGLVMTADSSAMTISGTPKKGTVGVYHLVFLMDDASFSGNPVTSIVPYTLVIEPYMENVALHKKATASSYNVDDDPPLSPEKTVDGKDSTRWCSDWMRGDVNDAWLKVDLGAVYDLNEVFILWETAVAAEYQLLVSDDDIHYKEVDVNGVQYNGLRHTWKINASGRYIKMQSIKAATPYGSSIFEFEVYGTPQVPPEQKYTVSFADGITNGNVTANPKTAAEGEKVALAVQPDEGYRLVEGSLKAFRTGDSSTLVPLLDNAFTMPAYDVTVAAQFEKIPTGTVAVTGVALDQKTLSLKTGDAPVPLTAAVLPTNATNQKITWSSDDPKIAQVDQNGAVTAVAEGIAVITVTTEDGNFTDHCYVTVEEKQVGSRTLSLTYNSRDVSLLVNGEPQKLADLTGRYVAENVEAGTEMELTFAPRIEGRTFRSVTIGDTEPVLIEGDQYTYSVTMGDRDMELHFVLEVVDKSILKQVYSYAKTYMEDGSVDQLIGSVKKVFQKAYNTAEAVMDDPAATQAEINSAWSGLLNAIHYLEFKPGDKSALMELCETLKNLKEEDYRENWASFEAALEEAEQVLSDDEALSNDITEAYNRLMDAFNLLVPAADFSELEALIARAEEIASEIALDKYLPDGQSAFASALEEAKALDKSASQEEIDAAADQLIRAMAGLRKIPSREELRAYIAELEQLDLNGYTSRSVANLKAALRIAKAAAADETASDKTLATVFHGLQEAEKALKKSDPKPSGKKSSGSLFHSNSYGAAGIVAVNPLLAAALNVSTGKACVLSDTVNDFVLKRGQSYCFKTTVVSGHGEVPSFTAGNGSVIKTQFVTKIGNDFYYRVWAIGAPGQSTGAYTQMPGQDPVKHCTVTIG
ncbi:glycoside hydrolase family 3 N-terminal domain-containing protein [Clostridium sp. D33t1_170424_F3]|uniref:putative Ig domain-containing protein n=1 Tax=Clostridium sp. D33t1_170424_F3 TaxID=2787099 RepID=UPI0018A8B8BE|nr:glycoside hydrolase family 3 N-terminal domain-containing protein [Clostridium sp. D33t1_170424_F3]